MRSTILFLTLLVFISCSQNMLNSYDTLLLEINKNPSSEAIFATMSMQLKQEGGFDRILALLNGLVEDGKKQLFEAKKTYAVTKARCDVSGMKFQERQDFYEGRLKGSQNAAEEAEAEKTNADSMVAFLQKSHDWFGSFLSQEVERHKNQTAMLKAVISDSQAAMDECDKTIKEVNDWKTNSASSVEASVNKIATAYLQIHKFQIVVPNSFIEMAETDDTIKMRLKEWLNQLKASFYDINSTATKKLADKQKIWTQIEKQINELISAYEEDITSLKSKHQLFVDQSNNAQKAITLYTKLVSDNAALVKSNADYCTVETTNFEKAQKVLDEQVALFKNVRDYFRTHYKKISEFIKDKYNKAK